MCNLTFLGLFPCITSLSKSDKQFIFPSIPAGVEYTIYLSPGLSFLVSINTFFIDVSFNSPVGLFPFNT
jgi:hypothetical protein